MSTPMHFLRLSLGLVALMLSHAAFACDQSGIGQAVPNTPQAGLNIMKNRSRVPMIIRRVTTAEMLAYPHHDDAALEASDGVILTGQLLQARHEGPESPNCGVAADYHIFMVPVDLAHPHGVHLTKVQLKARKKHAVVVELTPNFQDVHPDWGRNLQRALAGKNVCITGWLLYDPDHPPQLGHTRGTLWEIHPITGIGVLQADGSCAPWLTP